MFLFLSVRGEGKCEKNYKKIKKIFPPLGRFFDHFWWLVCRKIIRKCFGGKEKEYRAKKGNFKKKV